MNILKYIYIKIYAKKHKKILCLHGVNHYTYNSFSGYCEFSIDRSYKYIQNGINIFIDAFGEHPQYFKAPCYGLSMNNKIKLNNLGMTVIGPSSILFNKLFHTDSNNKIINYVNKFNEII